MKFRNPAPSRNSVLFRSAGSRRSAVACCCTTVVLTICFSTLTGRAHEPQAQRGQRKEANKAHYQTLRDNEVTLSAQVWGFSRVFPLLDGLLQDISATQVATVALNPNAPNGTSVDAVQQSLQFQLQYSQLAGAQNAATAQAATANSNYQTNLAQQETALMQQLVAAYSQVAAAQNNLNTLQASGTASTTDITTAQQALQGANANLTAVGNTITNFKNLASPSALSGSSSLASVPTLPGLTSSVLPSGVTSAATGTTNGSPSFPPTKQMDNQVNILWDRLARLVGAMARPDSMGPDDSFYLVRFDTGIFPLKREKQLLDVNYELSCGMVVDLFPRNAALNIVEDKYKDTAFGFGAVLNWFGVGGSVAYNREHLRASQMLGQSSYISGHGIGKARFGWTFGISLGDDSIAPGPRNTFALVWIPAQGCTDPTIKASSADWIKPPDFKLDFPKTVVPTSPLASLKLTNGKDTTKIKSIEFNRNEYDPTSGKAAPVTVRITLSGSMDQQLTVSVDGQLIQRVRDNFGRAITPTVTGTNGVLETAQFGINSWIPTSPTTVLVTLDSSQFGSQFPQILLSSPQGIIDVAHSRANDATVTVSGNTLNCAQAPCTLPSLGVLKTTPRNLGVARWFIDTGAGRKPTQKLCITVLDPEGGATPLSATGGVPSVQVISSADVQIWGGDPEVNALGPDGTMFRLTCEPQPGSRLVCEAPPFDDGDRRRSIQLQVIDQHHVGGISMKGFVSTKECSDAPDSGQPCKLPLIWKTAGPKLEPNPTTDVTKSEWKMWVHLVNVDAGDKAALGNFQADGVACTADPTNPCVASFTISMGQLNLVSDWMSFKVIDAKGHELGSRAAITNILTNIKPIITQIKDDRTSWSGQNLVFNNIRVGNSNVFKVDCVSDGSQCQGDGQYGKNAGFMYFVANGSLAFPFMQLNASGASTAVTFTPPKPPANPQVQPAVPTNGLAPNAFPLKTFPIQSVQ